METVNILRCSQVPLGTAINSIHLQSVNTKNIAELHQFYNRRGDGKFTIRGSLDSAYQAFSRSGSIALALEFYCSTDPRKKDPLVLSYTSEYDSKLNLTSVSTPKS